MTRAKYFFLVLAMVCFIGSFQAPHQLFIGTMCLIMYWAIIAQERKEKEWEDRL